MKRDDFDSIDDLINRPELEIEFRAKLADRIMCIWADQVMQSEQRETMRDAPEVLRSFMTGLITDLRILAEMAEISWDDLLADVQRDYAEIVPPI